MLGKRMISTRMVTAIESRRLPHSGISFCRDMITTLRVSHLWSERIYSTMYQDLERITRKTLALTASSCKCKEL